MEEAATEGLADREVRSYEPQNFTVIPLDCEITAYAPDGDDPLF